MLQVWKIPKRKSPNLLTSWKIAKSMLKWVQEYPKEPFLQVHLVLVKLCLLKLVQDKLEPPSFMYLVLSLFKCSSVLVPLVSDNSLPKPDSKLPQSFSLTKLMQLVKREKAPETNKKIQRWIKCWSKWMDSQPVKLSSFLLRQTEKTSWTQLWLVQADSTEWSKSLFLNLRRGKRFSWSTWLHWKSIQTDLWMKSLKDWLHWLLDSVVLISLIYATKQQLLLQERKDNTLKIQILRRLPKELWQVMWRRDSQTKRQRREWLTMKQVMQFADGIWKVVILLSNWQSFQGQKELWVMLSTCLKRHTSEQKANWLTRLRLCWAELRRNRSFWEEWALVIQTICRKFILLQEEW